MKSNIFAFSAKQIGFNHVKSNKVCEDASDYYADDKVCICVVADGHGSDNYPRTDRGANFAVNSSIHCILDFVDLVNSEDVLTDEKHDYDVLTQLAKSILKDWYDSVEKDYSAHPFTLEELKNVSDKYKKKYLSEDPNIRRVEKAYGCTLIAYVVTNQYSFGLQIGDGRCVLIQEDGTCTEPIPWDDNCQLNITTSICDSDAIDEFRFYVSDEFPMAVFCGSDGIDDSYSNSSEMYELYRSMLKIFADYGVEIGEKEIKEYLPTLTKKGSGDDVSVGLIVDLEKAKVNRQKLDIQTSLFKLENRLHEISRMLSTFSEKAEKVEQNSSEESVIERKIRDLRLQQKNLLSEVELLHKQLAEVPASEKTKEKSESMNSFKEKALEKTGALQQEPCTALTVVEAEKRYEIIIKGDIH